MNAEPIPGRPDQPAGTMCPSCGRFVGALTRCPHCGAHVEKRMSLRFFRYAALLLATVGLGLLYLMARNREVPLVTVGSIKPTMNFAYVRVKGSIAGDPRVYRQGGKLQSLRFVVDDGTGEIPVTAYRAQAEELLASDRVPRAGDEVEVAGSLSVSADDRILLRLQVPQQLTLSRADVPVTRLGDIGADDEGQGILVEGVIARVSAPRPNTRAPWSVTLRDESGQFDMTFWEDAYEEIADKILLAPGTHVRARVSVDSFRGKLQLRMARGADLEFPAGKGAASMTAGPGAPPAAEPETVPLASVTADLSGKTVQVEGMVADIRPPSEGSRAPYIVRLEDKGARVDVVYWDVVADNLGDKQPVKGAWMRVRGTVGVHRDRVQLKVEHSDQLLVLGKPAETLAAEPAQPVAISTVTAATAGKVMTLRGKLGEPRSIKGGIIYPFSDSSGSIQLVLWDRSVPGPERDALQAGVEATVTGEIVLYKETLEIVPASARAIVVAPGAGVTP